MSVAWRAVKTQREPPDVVDSTGSGYDADNFGAQLRSDSPFEPARSLAVEYDAANSEYAAIRDFTYNGSNYGDLTVAAWFRTTADGQIIASFDRSEYWRFGIGSSGTSGCLTFNFTDGGTASDLSSASTVNDGTWRFGAIRYDASAGELDFVLGDPSSSVGVDNTVTGLGSSYGTGATRYGFLSNGSEAASYDGSKGPTSYFDGSIGPFFVFHRALSNSELDTLKDQGLAGLADTTGLQLAYELQPDEYHDDRVVDVRDCTLAYNRFARTAEVILEDPDGAVPGEYPRPTPVALYVKRSIDTTWQQRFGGYVNNPKRDQNQATLELLSHDAWIRGRDVYRSYSATTISAILNDLITDLTPLTWNADRVNVYDDQSIDAEWSGTPLDKVIEELAGYSNDEIFGATDDMVFFFEQRDSNRAPRDFTAGEYFADEVEFEQDGSQELNEVTVYYGGQPASDAVVVEDAEAQKSLADELDADRPVVISTSKTFTEITTEAAARRKGRDILSGASEILTGELTTWEAFGVEPGDVTRVQVPEQSIDDEFRVAEISHSWADDETTLKLAENSDGVVDTLVELSDEVSRVEARAADNNATITRFTTFDLPFNLQLQVDAYKRTIPADQLLFGEHKGGWGDTRAGGGLWGDQRGAREKLL